MRDVERRTASSMIDVRRAADRFHTRLQWLDSKHCFSFSRYYDPGNTEMDPLPLVP